MMRSKRTLFVLLSIGALGAGLAVWLPIEDSEGTIVAAASAPRRDIAWQREDCLSREPLERTLFQSRLQNVDEEVAASLSRHFLWLCKKYHFDPLFISALIAAESGFNPEAVSPMGAIGLMQVMPSTAALVLRKTGVEVDLAELTQQLSDPFFNLTLGMRYLAQLRDQFRGRAQNFLAAYHGGPARVEQVLRGKRQPLASSQEYVRSIRIGLGLFRLQVPKRCQPSIRAEIRNPKPRKI